MPKPYFDGMTRWTGSQKHVQAVKAKRSGLIFLANPEWWVIRTT